MTTASQIEQRPVTLGGRIARFIRELYTILPKRLEAVFSGPTPSGSSNPSLVARA